MLTDRSPRRCPELFHLNACGWDEPICGAFCSVSHCAGVTLAAEVAALRVGLQVSSKVNPLVYDSIPSIQTSDHYPVWAAFEVGLRGASRKPGEAGEAMHFGETLWHCVLLTLFCYLWRNLVHCYQSFCLQRPLSAHSCCCLSLADPAHAVVLKPSGSLLSLADSAANKSSNELLRSHSSVEEKEAKDGKEGARDASGGIATRHKKTSGGSAKKLPVDSKPGAGAASQPITTGSAVVHALADAPDDPRSSASVDVPAEPAAVPVSAPVPVPVTAPAGTEDTGSGATQAEKAKLPPLPPVNRRGSSQMPPTHGGHPPVPAVVLSSAAATAQPAVGTTPSAAPSTSTAAAAGVNISTSVVVSAGQSTSPLPAAGGTVSRAVSLARSNSNRSTASLEAMTDDQCVQTAVLLRLLS